MTGSLYEYGSKKVRDRVLVVLPYSPHVVRAEPRMDPAGRVAELADRAPMVLRIDGRRLLDAQSLGPLLVHLDGVVT